MRMSSVDASPNHQVKLSSGGSTFRIMGMGKDEFPPLPEFGDEKAHTLEQAELRACSGASPTRSRTDETRYIAQRRLLQFQGGQSLACRDGRPPPGLVSKEMEVPRCERRGHHPSGKDR